MSNRIVKLLGAIATGVCLFAGAASHEAQAEDKALINLSAGMFDWESSRTQEFEGRIEYRSGYGLFESDGAFRGFKPLVGLMATTGGSVFGYAGLAAPFAFDDGRWEIVPSGGIGAYSKGNGLDLGGTFEFHLGIGASYAVTGDSRLGLAIYHISNAGTHRKNPGVNTVAVTWSFAFDGP
jgi:lipid A 3-O-deacylase